MAKHYPDLPSGMPGGGPESSGTGPNTGAGGHRKRMRQRVLEHGTGSLADYELVEMLLFCVIPRRDTKPLAKALLQKFGSLVGLFQASREALREAGLKERAIDLFQLPAQGACAMAQLKAPTVPMLGDGERLKAYLTALPQPKSFCRLLYLDSRNQLLCDEELVEAEHGLGNCVKSVATRALLLHATALIVVFVAPRSSALGLAQGVRGLMLELQPLSIVVHDGIMLGLDKAQGVTWMMSLYQEGLL